MTNKTAFALRGAAVAALLAAGLAPQAAQAQRPSFITGVCLDGGRSAAVCDCADEKLAATLPEAQYREYEDIAAERFANPSANPTLRDAAVTMAEKRSMSVDEVVRNVTAAVELHRSFMRECN